MHALKNLIGDCVCEPSSGQFLDVVEPATGKTYARVPDSDAQDVDRAVAAAEGAFHAWARTPAADRCRVMWRIADFIERDLEGFARAESTDTGKPLSLARKVDIPRAVANFRHFATAILHWASESHRTDDRAINYTLRQPLGVVGCISPWNLPLYLLSWKVAPAIAVGNTVVAKPSEITPMTAFRLSEVCREAGLPPGVLNIVHGRGAEAGAAIVGHAQTRAISFTGGTATGQAIARAAAPMFKKLALEMGGKNPTLIFADADLERAIPESVRAAFANQGEICLCGSRVFVHEPIFDDFVERFLACARTLKVGDPMEDSTDLGALVSAQHLDKVASYVDLAREEGGEVLLGGNRAEPPNKRCAGGYFHEPTVIVGLPPDCRTQQEEIFGPLVTITPFGEEDEAVAMANSTRYGLSASLWTRDLDRALRFAERLDAGTVWVNCWMLRDLRVPFGGVKSSGTGREGGHEILRFFTEPKNVCIRYPMEGNAQ